MSRKLTHLKTCALTFSSAVLALAVFLPSEPLRAADAAAAVTNAPPKPHWESVASLDLTLTRGNSRNFLATGTVDTKRKSEKNEILLGAGAGYGDTQTTDSTGKEVDTKTQDYLKGYAQWNHLFTERFYAGLRLEGLHDDIADIQYRLIVSPLAGYYFVKTTNTFLSGETGPTYVNQEIGGRSESYIALRLAERFEHKFKSGARIWESLEFLPQVDDFNNWILNAEAGVSAPVTKSLDLRLVAQDTYNNQPAAGLLKNDLKLLAGVGYRF